METRDIYRYVFPTICIIVALFTSGGVFFIILAFYFYWMSNQ